MPQLAFRPVVLRYCLLAVWLLLQGVTLHAQADKVTLELEDVDIKDFVRWGAQATNQTIIIHPRVSGRVTVIAGEPIGKDEAFQVFLATLEVHGFTVIESDGALKVIPATEAKESELPLYDPNVSVGAENIVVKILKVENVAAAEVVNLLKPIASKYSYIAAYPPTNALIIADRSTKIIQLERIIEEIDLAGEIEVAMVELVYANAEEVARTIEQLLKDSRSGPDSKNFKLTVDSRTNSILLTGDSITKEQIHDLISRMDRPIKGSGNTTVVRLQYADATKLVPILETVSGSIQKGVKDQSISNVDVKIRAHEPLNALIVTAPPSVMETMRSVIAELDTRRTQVLVEAIIVEVSEDISRDLGIKWQTNLETDDAVFGSVSALPSVISDGITVTGGVASAGTGLALGYFKGSELRGLIRALEGNSQANILSTPSIVALDNEQAEILVGSNVPFVTGSIQRAGDINPFQTIQRQDIGITLKIKPRINNSNSLTLEIEQKVESIGQTDARTADIITNKRELKTRVLIENDDVLVLGGLMSDEVSENESKVPFLGDIPILGRLFRSTSNFTSKRNLMVFIHPIILADRASGNTVSRARYLEMRDRQLEFRDRVERYLLPRDVPTLPAMEVKEAPVHKAQTVEPEPEPSRPVMRGPRRR